MRSTPTHSHPFRSLHCSVCTVTQGVIETLVGRRVVVRVHVRVLRVLHLPCHHLLRVRVHVSVPHALHLPCHHLLMEIVSGQMVRLIRTILDHHSTVPFVLRRCVDHL